MSLKRAIDGTRYTHVKRTFSRRIVGYSFELTRMKALELLQFHRTHIASDWLINDHKGKNIRGKCKTNPLVLNNAGRGPYASGEDFGSEDFVTVDFEFEGLFD